MTATTWRTWRAAMQDALYGEQGFYRRPEGPAGHFRTSVTASPLFAAAVLRLAERVDGALGAPSRFDLVDVGAGRGELLAAVAALAPVAAPALAARLRLSAVELAARPPELPPTVGWHADLAVLPPARGLLLANELLDTVPLDVVTTTLAGLRLVEVDLEGRERAGGPPTPEDLDWLARWWPLAGAAAGARAEVGAPRDRAWATAVGHLERGLAVAVDYAHDAAGRRAGRYQAGTLTGYRAGRQVPPVPDGSCDLTAHVALDACADLAARGGARCTSMDQHQALRALGVRGDRPPRETAVRDPTGYLRALQEAGRAAELTDRDGLGSFGWLLCGVALRPEDVLSPSEG